MRAHNEVVTSPPSDTDAARVVMRRADGSPVHVLVVDDEPNILELLATSLRFAGFEVVTAANGRDADPAALYDRHRY